MLRGIGSIIHVSCKYLAIGRSWGDNGNVLQNFGYCLFGATGGRGGSLWRPSADTYTKQVSCPCSLRTFRCHACTGVPTPVCTTGGGIVSEPNSCLNNDASVVFLALHNMLHLFPTNSLWVRHPSINGSLVRFLLPPLRYTHSLEPKAHGSYAHGAHRQDREGGHKLRPHSSGGCTVVVGEADAGELAENRPPGKCSTGRQAAHLLRGKRQQHLPGRRV